MRGRRSRLQRHGQQLQEEEEEEKEEEEDEEKGRRKHCGEGGQ